VKCVFSNVETIDDSIVIAVKNEFLDSPTSRDVLGDVVAERFLSKIGDIEMRMLVSITIKKYLN
jgi:hypothetical protein